VDGIRLDHFRGFSSYYRIPCGAPATEGIWEAGPGQAFFDAIRDLTDGYPVIAEDLGIIDGATAALRSDNGFLSTRVFQFAFLGDPESPHLPHLVGEDCALYSGTHDNATLCEYLDSLTEEGRAAIAAYCGLRHGEPLSLGVIRTLLAAAARYTILPLADLLGLGGEARINVPGRAEGNWRHRVTGAQLDLLDTAALHALLLECGRLAE
jgi:4-alpha-glucanotransferase